MLSNEITYPECILLNLFIVKKRAGNISVGSILSDI